MFDQFVKTRAEEERKEKKNKLMQAKEDFRKMMEDARLNVRCVGGCCFCELVKPGLRARVILISPLIPNPVG